MAANGRKLKAAFLTREETQDFLANLEKLKEEGSVTDEQYEPLRTEYHQRLTTIDAEIVALKNSLNTELESSRRDLALYNAELEKLGTKYKVGEVPLEKYRSTDQKLRRRIEQIESNISQLETLINANSSAEIGMVAWKPGVASSEAWAFTEFVSSPEEIISPRRRLLGPIGALLLFISVFLPWISVEGFGFGPLSFSGMQIEGAIGALGIICALVGMGAAFLAQARTRGLLHIVVGAVALIIFMAAFVPDWVVTSRILEQLGVPGGILNIAAGVYIYLLACVAVFVGGLLDFRP